MKIKSYRYISQLKVAMLFAQIPKRKWEVKGLKLKTNNVVLEAELEINNIDLKNDIIYSQLDDIIVAMDKACLIGTISQKHLPFFRATMEMKSLLRTDQLFIYGTMDGPEKYFCVLGGSPNHLIGYQGYDNILPRRDPNDRTKRLLPKGLGSHRPLITHRIKEVIAEIIQPNAHKPLIMNSEGIRTEERIEIDVQDFVERSRDHELFSQNVVYDEGKVEFVAKRLAHGRGRARNEIAVLGSPIYISSVND